MVRRGAALIAMALAGCTAAAAPQAAGPRPSVVSLNPCTDAILAEVADPGQIRAISHYSHNAASSSMELSTARRFAAVSGSVEEVLALKPDLVVASTFLPPATLTALGRLGIRVERVPIAATVEESRAQVRALAALVGHPGRGEALIARMDGALARAAPPTGSPVAAVVWQSGGIVAGEGTLISDLLTRTGFANAAAARGMRQAEALPLEALLADPPRVILAAGSAAAQEDRMLRHPALAALRQTRRERLDPALLWCGGPTVIRAAERLGAIRRSL